MITPKYNLHETLYYLDGDYVKEFDVYTILYATDGMHPFNEKGVYYSDDYGSVHVPENRCFRSRKDTLNAKIEELKKKMDE